jgi:hypothetical protein
MGPLIPFGITSCDDPDLLQVTDLTAEKQFDLIANCPVACNCPGLTTPGPSLDPIPCPGPLDSIGFPCPVECCADPCCPSVLPTTPPTAAPTMSPPVVGLILS